jgi:hypothetical protein
MVNLSKSIAVFALLALLALVMGCTSLSSDKDSFGQLAALQDKYGVKATFSPNVETMNDYISDLSLLRGKAGGSAAKVLDAELYSAQTFYYLGRALSASATIDFQKMGCSSKEIRGTVSSISLAENYYNKAVPAINALSNGETKYLRPSQLETIQGYGDKITQIKAFFAQKC